MLTAEQLAARENKLTASRVACLMSGDETKILDLWREMVGDPSFVPEDLSGVWPVRLGAHTEPLHLDWIEWQTGAPVTRRGEVVVHPQAEWAACTLDGWQDGRPVECKHVGAFVKASDVMARYTAQLHWQMLVCGASEAVLSVIYGAAEPTQEVVPLDADYAAELWRRAEAFMACVRSLTPPVVLPAFAAPTPPEKWRSFDLDAMQAAGEAWPNWAHAMHPDLGSWAETAGAAKRNAAAVKAIKELLPDDVGRLACEGVVVSRAKNGAVTVKGART